MRRIPPGAPILAARAMRAAEQRLFDAGTAQDELMERAGLAVANEVARFAAGRPVLVLAGPGNNGGDGYVAARRLAARGLDVGVAALGTPAEGAATRMAGLWTGDTADFFTADARPVVVDGLYGTGVTRPLEERVRDRLAVLRRSAEFCVAIDLPSGIAADGGDADAAGMPAEVTVALGALKPAHVLGAAAVACGHVLLAPIGMAPLSSWTTLATPELPLLAADVHKYTRGMVAVVAGTMPGAARLAAAAALHGGAGYVVLAGPASAEAVPHAIVRRSGDLAAIVADLRLHALVIGCGLGRSAESADLLEVALASDRDLVLDGDALGLLGAEVGARAGADRRRVVLTPHTGEFERMFGGGGGSKIDRTLAAATATGATIVHKGADTVIAEPGGRVIVAADATPWLSTAGSGDVLAGLVGARLAGRRATAAAEAVWLHARAAAHAGIGFAADDLVPQVPTALAEARWV